MKTRKILSRKLIIDARLTLSAFSTYYAGDYLMEYKCLEVNVFIFYYILVIVGFESLNLQYRNPVDELV